MIQDTEWYEKMKDISRINYKKNKYIVQYTIDSFLTFTLLMEVRRFDLVKGRLLLMQELRKFLKKDAA